MRRLPRSAALALVGALVGSLAGCGTGPTVAPSAATPTMPPSAAPSGPPSAAAASSASAATTTGSDAPAVAADPTLLAIVPAGAAGLRLDYDPDTTASVAADPELAADVERLAIGLAVPNGEASPSDFVIVSVVRLRNPSAGDEWFRAWRDTYDDGACGQAGGVSGHAQAEMGGRTVYVGTCAGGATTYHVRLNGGADVVSLTSVGPGRPGESIVRAIP